MGAKEQWTLERGSAGDVLLSALQNARARTLDLLTGATDAALDRGEPNTVGSVLYHIAAIEADYLYDDVLGTPDAIPTDLFPHPVREEDGVLTSVTGYTLDEHLARLATVRQALIEAYASFDDDRLHSVRELPNYVVSPAYVLHHLMQHEAEHRAEIGRAARG